MTEAEWLTCDDPLAMLEFIAGTATDRKLRLFVVDACRRCSSLLADKPYGYAVDVAERFAERLATANELASAHRAAYRVAVDGEESGYSGPLWWAGWFENPYWGALGNADSPDAPAVLAASASMTDAKAAAALCVPWAAALGVGTNVQAAVLRDVVHAPYRAIHWKASWRWWNGGTAVKLAKAIYRERGFDRLPILADALEEAGCDNEEMLNHCRQPFEHVRGCWLLDLVLGNH